MTKYSSENLTQRVQEQITRRTFLRNSALLSVPVVLGSLPLPKIAQAGAFTLPKPGSASVNVRQFGTVGNGIADDTAAIQKAINSLPASGGTVFVPAGKYLIDALKTIKLRSNQHFKMDPSAVLIAKTNSSTRYYVLSLMNVSNVMISGGRIIGDRDKHPPTGGEWGYGIQVGGRPVTTTSGGGTATRVLIRDIHISKCWGDGICLGGGATDVEIDNVVCTQNRRQGLSITRANNVRVLNSEFSYTKGTSPECGIDVEPDPPSECRRVLIQNCLLKGNNKYGLCIFERAYGVTVRNCTITDNVSCGIATTGCFDTYIVYNLIQHNGATGIRFNIRTKDLQVSRNTFFNNYNRNGDRDRADFTYTGYNNTLDRDMLFTSTVTPGASDIRITTNYYK